MRHESQALMITNRKLNGIGIIFYNFSNFKVFWRCLPQEELRQGTMRGIPSSSSVSDFFVHCSMRDVSSLVRSCWCGCLDSVLSFQVNLNTKIQTLLPQVDRDPNKQIKMSLSGCAQ